MSTYREAALSYQIKLSLLQSISPELQYFLLLRGALKKSTLPPKIKCTRLGKLTHLFNNALFFFFTPPNVICNMMFLICQSQWSSGAKVHPQCRESLTFRSCNNVPYFQDKITDMLNEAQVNEAMFHSFLCHRTRRHPSLWGRLGTAASVFPTPSSSSASLPRLTPLSR